MRSPGRNRPWTNISRSVRAARAVWEEAFDLLPSVVGFRIFLGMFPPKRVLSLVLTHAPNFLFCMQRNLLHPGCDGAPRDRLTRCLSWNYTDTACEMHA